MIWVVSTLIAVQAAQVGSLSKMQIDKENLQIQVYDAVELMHKDEWAGKSLPVDQLLQISSLTDSQLDERIKAHISLKGGQKQKNQANMLELDCIVGGENCLYSNKTTLIAGNISTIAQQAFNDGKSVRLPGQSDLLFTEAKAGQSIIIDEKSFDSNGKLNIDQLLESKLQEDIKKQNGNSSQVEDTPPAGKEDVQVQTDLQLKA